MSQLRHLLFDNDGTVVDSEIIAVRVMLRHLGDFGIQISERDYSQRFPGLLESDIVAILSEEHDLVLPEDFLHGLRDEHLIGFLGAAHVHDGHAEKLLDCGADFLAVDAPALGRLLRGFGAR